VKTLTPGLVLLVAAAAVACSQEGPGSSPASPSTALPSVSSTLSTQGGGKLPATLPVTTILSATDSYGMPADIAGGTYGDNTGYLTANGYNGIAYGDWQFLKSTTGRILFSFGMPGEAVLIGDPHYTAPANPPFSGTQALVGHMEVKCTFLGKSMLTMTAGSVITCPLLPKFTTSAGIDLSLSLGPSFTGFAETTDIQITCNSVETTVAPVGCNDWYMDPIAPAQAGVARLAGTTKGGATIDDKVNDGDFYIRFHFHITRP
jgi:hypothetical protein